MRAIIADDHPVVRDATAAMLRRRYGETADMVCVGTYDALLLALEMGRTDLIIADLDMPDLGSARNLSTVARKAGTVPLIVFSSSQATPVVRSAKQQGASGYVCKADASETLLQAVETVLAGGQFFEAGVLGEREALAARPARSEAAQRAFPGERRSCAPAAHAPSELPPLTPRQEQILRFVGQGLSNKEIGRRLGISGSTVKVHMHSLFERLGVQNRTQAALIARGPSGAPRLDREVDPDFSEARLVRLFSSR